MPGNWQNRVIIAFDAPCQGERTGEPWHLENPYVRTEGISVLIDYLTPFSYVDNGRNAFPADCYGQRCREQMDER